ncbi:DDE-type integrase/transposase/recombinase [Caballeronia mineralivorans]|uniref:DDE-type integrase/transposase/recombinase n=1 Tax=Caballeronia mineralivorans TaxID=2010198 RepID=UPI0023F402A8|nr:DDE-type integrase/transposase/recombinase [Caballeronia mineralivorans]
MVRGQWVYLYRAVNRTGNTVDFRLSTGRGVAASKGLLREGNKKSVARAETITLDGYAAARRAARE